MRFGPTGDHGNRDFLAQSLRRAKTLRDNLEPLMVFALGQSLGDRSAGALDGPEDDERVVV